MSRRRDVTFGERLEMYVPCSANVPGTLLKRQEEEGQKGGRA